MARSNDYHDYVFKDGRLVGEFDQMYKYSADVPWHQDETARSVFSDIDIAILRQYSYGSICEVGCGLGYFSERLCRELRGASKLNGPSVTGVDISGSAVEKARALFPQCRFIAGDLLAERPLKEEQFDLVVIKEVLWYVTHGLDRFVSNLLDMVKDGGFLFVSQSFPEEDTWVGKDVIDSPETLKSIFVKILDLKHYCLECDWNCGGRPLVHMLGKKR